MESNGIFIIKKNLTDILFRHSQTHPDLPDDSIPKCEFEGWITHECAEKILETCGLSYRELVKQATLRGFKPLPLSDMYLSLTIHNTFRKFVSHNIIGYIPGSKRPDELNFPFINQEFNSIFYFL